MTSSQLEAILSAPAKPGKKNDSKKVEAKKVESLTDILKFERKDSNASNTSMRSRKAYNFSPQVNNMYHGLPSTGPLKKSDSIENI